MLLLANIFGFGNPVEIAIIAGVVVLLFGGSKLATFGKSLGEGMKEFKKAAHEAGGEPDPQPSAPQMMEQPGASGAAADNGPHTSEATLQPAKATKE